jgi:probable selenium-dependent hydroxylase accessory protein YqeC
VSAATRTEQTRGKLLKTESSDRDTRHLRSLREALGLRDREVVSLVGGGGKTTLMFLLGKTLSAQGHRVITTTTTKIFEPRHGETPFLSLGEDEGTVLLRVEHYGHVTVASHRVPGGKVQGITVRQADALWDSGRIDYLVNEADGAAQRPLKAPESYEPVIPDCTSVVVALVGADAFNARLDENTVFRSRAFSRLTGLPLGAHLTYETIALIFTHEAGLAKGAPRSARIVPFVNKTDLDQALQRGREFGKVLLDAADVRIDRVVLGHLRADPPIADVIFR